MDIATARRNAGMTQNELADRLGVSRAAVANWEVGAAYPAVENARALRDCLGISLDDIYSDHSEAA